jgi:CIC family chloride channel protein
MIVLGNFSMTLFAPLVLSAVVSTMVSRSFFGIKPWYTVPAFDFTRVTQLPWFILLGIVCGVMGAAFLRMLDYSEQGFQRMNIPIYARLTLGGLIVGIIATEFPEVWGNGYSVTDRLLSNPYLMLHEPFAEGGHVLMFLGALLLAKLLATLATVGSGAVGGVFTPTLFLGGCVGALFGLSLEHLGRAGSLPLAVFTVVGMGSMLSATTRSPLLAMIMILEISLDYSLMPPLMLGCVISTLVAGRLHPASIYTEPLRRKGLSVSHDDLPAGAATERTVGDLMRTPVVPVSATARLNELAHRFLTGSNNFLPVVDSRQQLIGMVALQDLKEHLNSGEELSAVIAYDVMRPPPACVTPNQRLLDVLPVVMASELRNIPVVNTLKENRLVGALARSEVLGLFSEAISASSKSTESS